MIKIALLEITFLINLKSIPSLPAEDINITLHTGGSVQEASYSGVVVQAVEGGYKLFGYDIVHPYFNTLVPLISGRSKKVRVGGKSISPVGYNPGTTYHRDEIVQHEEKYYQATTTHVSLTTDKSPDMNKWKLLKVLPTVGGTEVEHYFDYDENQIKNMSEFVKKSDIVAEKIARRKEVTKEIKEMRSVGNYDGAEFLLNELRNLNRMIKNFSK